jgi:hypothetical protein
MKAALGFRVHSGWAAIVVLAEPLETPSVLIRRRIEIVDPKLPGSKQPYHAAQGRSLKDAETLIGVCAESSGRLALDAVRAVIEEVGQRGCEVGAAGIAIGSGKPLPSLEKILKAHPLLHTAEGEFFRHAIGEACKSCGLAISEVKEKTLMAECSARLRVSEDELQQNLISMGKLIGPPWRQDEKLASLVAWMVLAGDFNLQGFDFGSTRKARLPSMR